MSDFTTKISELLAGGLTKPKSLDEEKGGINMFLDDLSVATPNENNLLSLLTVKDLVSDEDKEIVKKIAQEETKHLINAMKLLTEEPDDSNAGMARKKLQDKFGKDTRGAVSLAQLLKDHENKDKFDAIIRSATGRTASGASSSGALNRGDNNE